MKRINYFLSLAFLFGLSACTYNQLTSIDCSLGPVLTTREVVDANCNQNDGRISVQATGGVGELAFQINNEAFQGDPVFDNLAAGIYTITVRDANNCTSTQSVQVNNLDGINIQLSTEAAGCETAQGRIVVETFGGQAPYEYAINGGVFQSSNIFNNLSAGNFQVIARDAQGCSISQNAVLTSGVSFQNTIQVIIETNCALPNCHGGSQPPDLRGFANIQNQRERIRVRTSNRSMPVGGLRLTDEQIQAISCWVEDGAPQN